MISLVYAEEALHVGKIYWEKEIISANSFAEIIVEDDDMNKKPYPNFADKFTILVWSDSTQEKIEIEVVETGVYTGKFKGSIYIADSEEQAGKRLLGKPGDILYAQYVDTTLPLTYSGSSEISAGAVVKVSGEDMTEYLAKIPTEMRPSQATSSLPQWLKNNAGWWAEGEIDDDSFVQGIQFLIKENFVTVVASTPANKQSAEMPQWVKNTAGWWADGTISDEEFISAIQNLISTGVIVVETTQESVAVETTQNVPSDLSPQMAALYSELAECSEIKKAYDRIGCEKEANQNILVLEYKTNSEQYEVGPVTFYYSGADLEITPSGQAILQIKILAENSGSKDNVVLFCSGPSVCNYDVTSSEKAFKYASTNFVSGQLSIKPNTAFEINMMFGPNIGYGGTKFEYDSAKEYYFRISESWGSAEIPLNLQQ